MDSNQKQLDLFIRANVMDSKHKQLDVFIRAKENTKNKELDLLLNTRMNNTRKKTHHIVDTNYGLQYSKVFLGINCEVFIEMINDEIIRKVGSNVDLSIKPQCIITLDGEPYEDFYGMLFINAPKYLGPDMDIESILKHFLSKYNIIIIPAVNMPSMCRTIGIHYNSWLLMYNAYIIYCKQNILPYDNDFVNVLEVLLHKHSIRDW